MGPTVRTILVWIGFIIAAILLYQFVAFKGHGEETRITYSEFLDEIQQGSVERVKIVGSEVSGVTRTNKRFSTVIADDPELTKKLREAGVQITVEKPAASTWFQSLLSFAPFLFIIGFWIFFMRQMQSGRIKALMNDRDQKARDLKELIARLDQLETRLKTVEAQIPSR
jgi:cell division protease FtsH